MMMHLHGPWRVMLFVPVWLSLFLLPLWKYKSHTRTDNEIGGSWVTDPQAQTFLLDLLRRTETEHGWPWTFLIQKLSQDWHLTVR